MAIGEEVQNLRQIRQGCNVVEEERRRYQQKIARIEKGGERSHSPLGGEYSGRGGGYGARGGRGGG